MKKFPGHISGFDNKRDAETQSEDVLIEVTETDADGTVEIAMNDRNERFYVRFRLQDLTAAAMAHASGTTS